MLEIDWTECTPEPAVSGKDYDLSPFGPDEISEILKEVNFGDWGETRNLYYGKLFDGRFFLYIMDYDYTFSCETVFIGDSLDELKDLGYES